MKSLKLKAALLAAAAAFVLSACGDEKSAQQAAFETVDKIDGQTMGTFYSVTVPGGYTGGSKALKNEAESAFKEVIDAISTFDSHAEIARFNEFKSCEPFEVSPYLAKILEEIQHTSRRINFATDITVGPLVNLWGFGPEARPEKEPSQLEIDEVRAYVGPDRFEIRQGKIPHLIKADPRVKLDLSTVGEGLGADALAARLDQQGVENYMVAIAGAIRSKGVNPRGQQWRVGIENPVNPSAAPFAVVCPMGMGMSTSGTYRNFFIDENTGERFSHIIDPISGKPIKHRTVSVTVIAQSTLETDTLDTGLMVMGADAALKWAEENEAAIYTVEINDKGEPVGRYSRYMEPYLKCQAPKDRLHRND